MLTKDIYNLMKKVGFPAEVAVTMTAIALRESGGSPNAFNGNTTTGDRYYGLLQINMLDKNVAALLHKNNIAVTNEKELLDPEVNARAGFLLWGKNNNNLKLAWYITKPKYKERYESHLPEVQMVALGF